MPWTPAQHRLFEWVAHGGYSPGLPRSKAAEMAHEGIKGSKPREKVANALVKQVSFTKR